MAKQYETVIGLEVHVELATKTKIFCGCSTQFGEEPNTHTCPVCTGMPGSLPVLNRKVVEYAIAVGLATNCSITRHCRFDRKNYFYPDNPQNYQISQLYLPICRDGFITVNLKNGEKKIGIHEIHMEEDAGKLVHNDAEDSSLIDYNRSGVPLIEIVTEPDMRSAEEVIEFLEKLRFIIQYLGASDCKLQEGSMRVDVNLSVKEVGKKENGTRTEMKNLNSFRAISHAIAGERTRQIQLLGEGKQIMMETRRWDDQKECSYSMRSKEDARDYRYFPDPDLAPVSISEEWLEQIGKRQPRLRDELLVLYREKFGIPDYDAQLITESRRLAELFEATVAICGNPKKVSNWIIGETMRLLKERKQEPDSLVLSPEKLAKLILLAEKGTINSNTAKAVFEKLFDEDIEPEEYIAEHGLKMENREEELLTIVKEVLCENPKSVEDYKNGKQKALGFLVGQAMKATKGKADPCALNKLLKNLLD